MASLSFTSRTPIRFTRSLHDMNVEVIPVGIEYEFVLRTLAGDTVATVRMSAIEASDLMAEMGDVDVPNVAADAAYQLGYEDGIAGAEAA